MGKVFRFGGFNPPFPDGSNITPYGKRKQYEQCAPSQPYVPAQYPSLISSSGIEPGSESITIPLRRAYVLAFIMLTLIMFGSFRVRSVFSRHPFFLSHPDIPPGSHTAEIRSDIRPKAFF